MILRDIWAVVPIKRTGEAKLRPFALRKDGSKCVTNKSSLAFASREEESEARLLRSAYFNASLKKDYCQ